MTGLDLYGVHVPDRAAVNLPAGDPRRHHLDVATRPASVRGRAGRMDLRGGLARPVGRKRDRMTTTAGVAR
ncbi:MULTISPECIES: hypothetical protein [Frankia]|uniref:hypothetical protein n=1 Tax=Frankia TaxID=1854 RepID=UPI0021187F2B|nr:MULTISPECIES: hypothetical protein [Frankia]